MKIFDSLGYSINEWVESSSAASYFYAIRVGQAQLESPKRSDPVFPLGAKTFSDSIGRNMSICRVNMTISLTVAYAIRWRPFND
jgi:hypothetical protein